jgi:L-amino acid N-acyltransferase
MNGALCRNRTDDLFLTMEMRYRLCQEGEATNCAGEPAIKQYQSDRETSVALSAMTIRLRPVELSDAQGIRNIYNAEVLDSTVTMDLVPRTLAEQQQWIEAHQGAHGALVAVETLHGFTTSGTIGGVTGNEVILGFASISPYRSRPGYSTTVENSIYVHREHQSRGIGRNLLDEVLHLAEESGFHSCMARILAGHEASIRLHASRGFDLVGVEREVGRKFGRWIDITLMQKLF